MSWMSIIWLVDPFVLGLSSARVWKSMARTEPMLPTTWGSPSVMMTYDPNFPTVRGASDLGCSPLPWSPRIAETLPLLTEQTVPISFLNSTNSSFSLLPVAFDRHECFVVGLCSKTVEPLDIFQDDPCNILGARRPALAQPREDPVLTVKFAPFVCRLRDPVGVQKQDISFVQQDTFRLECLVREGTQQLPGRFEIFRLIGIGAQENRVVVPAVRIHHHSVFVLRQFRVE